MSKELAIVSLDWSLAATGLLRPTFLATREAFLPTDFSARKRDNMLELIARGIEGRKRSEVRQHVAKRAANHFVKYLNPDAVHELHSLVDNGHDLVALSSAPDFAVQLALLRIKQRTGLRFAGAVSSRFKREAGHYTGEYQSLIKLRDVDVMLAQRETAEATVGYINSASDEIWAGLLCGSIATFGSGNALHEAITARRQATKIE